MFVIERNIIISFAILMCKDVCKNPVHLGTFLSLVRHKYSYYYLFTVFLDLWCLLCTCAVRSIEWWCCHPLYLNSQSSYSGRSAVTLFM